MSTARNSAYKTADEIVTNLQLADLPNGDLTTLGAELDLTGVSDRDLFAEVDVDLGSINISAQKNITVRDCTITNFSRAISS